MTTAKLTYCALILTSILNACSTTRLVPENKQLLSKNRIEFSKPTSVDLKDQKEYVIQQPNRKLFGFYSFHLRIYQMGAAGLDPGEDTSWLRRTLMGAGEPPVIIDSTICQLTAQRLSEYYFNKGFLGNRVWYEIQPHGRKHKKGKVIYHVDLKAFRTIRSLDFVASSLTIDRLLDSSQGNSLLKVGDRLDFGNIERERNRISELLRDRGFFYFNNSYVDFSLDTNRADGSTDILVNIRSRRDLSPHQTQHIDKISVLIGSGPDYDTSMWQGIQFLNNSFHIDLQVLTNRIGMRPGDLYDASRVRKTYNDLLNLGLFRFVTIRFVPSGRDSARLLNAELILQTTKKHDFIIEPQVISSEQGSGIEANAERNFGIGNTMVLRNRNVLGGAESFNITSNTALESQFRTDDTRTFSNVRQSFSAEYVLPSLVFVERTAFGKSLSAKHTSFSGSYLYENNVNYERHVLPFTFTYGFQYRQTSLSVVPFRLSFNRSIIEPSFLDNVSDASRSYITQLLTNNIITGPVVSVFWSNQHPQSRRFIKLRSNALEFSGTMPAAYYSLLTKQTGLNKEVLGVKYSQYARTDIDLSLTHRASEAHSLAYRFYGGIGLPYGNSAFLPFERRFFVGGGNSLRAWRPRTIGPGDFQGEAEGVSIDKTGELLLQANTEYRFTVIDDLLEGALFMDAGNIWNINRVEGLEEGNFHWNSFASEFALNTGIGTRWDLQFLIFRVDWGLGLHNPSEEKGQRWVVKDFGSNDWITRQTALNFAVGYPF